MAEERSRNESVAAKFTGLPMSDLIAGPLTAVCDSQVKLAQASYDYMMKIGFDDDGNTRLLKFDLERPRRDRSSYKWNQPEERRENRRRERAFRDDYVYGDFSDYYASFGYGNRDEFVEADYQESDDPSDRNYGGRLRQHYYPYSFTVNDRKSIARQRGVLSDDGKEAKCESCRKTHKLGLMDLHHRPPLAKRIIRGERSEDSRRSFFDPERILVLCKSCHKQLHKDKPRYYYPLEVIISYCYQPYK